MPFSVSVCVGVQGGRGAVDRHADRGPPVSRMRITDLARRPDDAMLEPAWAEPEVFKNGGKTHDAGARGDSTIRVS